MALIVPKGYKTVLDSYAMQRAISFIKQAFQEELAVELNLKRVSAPLFVTANSGLNDNLSGLERPVSFDIPAISKDAQVVHSLAKWKRLALKRYNFKMHEGLYTDMNAIRRDEEQLDNLHSVYVDQWDWEKVISASDRTINYLYETVENIVRAIYAVSKKLADRFDCNVQNIEKNVTFITSYDLEKLYPDLSSDEREFEFTKKHKTVFISKIGYALNDGKPHSKRAPDYDDWELNGDLLFWSDVLNKPMELSSMGVRVDQGSLARQLEVSDCVDRRNLPFHKALLDGELPLTIGGGIGQSRLCMLLIGCAHIGEVQSSIWDEQTLAECEKAGIRLL